MVEPGVGGESGAYWADSPAELLDRLKSGPQGLSDAEATARRATLRDAVVGHHRRPVLRILVSQFTSPISLVLVSATIVSMALGDIVDGAIIITIIAASGLLGFWQEYRADSAVAQLLETVQVTVSVRRGGQVVERPVGQVVPGDVIELSAGNLVPGDARLIESESLEVDASALTGESFPAEKDAAAPVEAGTPLAERVTIVHFGSHVVSGRAVAVVVAIGRHTEFGRVAGAVGTADVRTAFEIGIGRFGWLLLRIVLALTAFIFVVNWAFGRPLFDALLFALSLAVGVTPQMLPAIVSVSLATGARRLAERHVVVKRLDAIEDLGAITVLCTDKTGTLTLGVTEVSAAVGWDGTPRDDTLALAADNAAAQRGFRNPIDEAILRLRPSTATALDELSYDFQRKRLSVLVSREGGELLIAKGAVAGILDSCVQAAGREPAEWEADRAAVARLAETLAGAGNRVIAVASRPRAASDGPLTLADEAGLRLEGLVVLADQVKPGAAEAITELSARAVSVRLITGDSAASARGIATAVGLDASRIMVGSEIARLDERRLASLARGIQVFAEVEPLHKERVVRALRRDGEVVAFLGDGINDAPALHAADVGISVDTGVDVAKQAASVVLLEKGLDVVCAGVELGRQTFANTLKYIRLTTSANFGNMASLAIASLVLPFFPLLPRQILLLNFLSDIPAMTIASDQVDAEQLARPIRWNLGSLRNFMIAFGLLSTVFDLLTFAILIWGFGADEALFQGSWFVMSTLTELAVLFSLRTARPIWASRPARWLVISSVLVAAIVVAVPYVPIAAELLALTPPSPVLFGALLLVLLGYVAANELLKRPLRRLLSASDKAPSSPRRWPAR